MPSIAPASSSDSHMYSPNSQPQSTQKRPSSFRMIDPQRITEPAMQAPAGNRCGRTSSEDERMNTSRTRSPPSITPAQPQVMSVAQIASDQTAGKMVYDPSHPDANAQGYVQMPNVDTVTEMVDLIDSSRAYEANVTAMQASKQMFTKTLDLLR